MPRTVLRALFMVVFAIAGFLLGREAYAHMISLHVASEPWLLVLTILVPIVGAVTGLVIAPRVQGLFEVELDEVARSIERRTPAEIVGGVVGLIAGLVVAFLIQRVLLDVVAGFGTPGATVADAAFIVVAAFLALLGVRIGAAQRFIGAPRAAIVEGPPAPAGASSPKIIDTSVIVDGRVLDIVASGFLESPLVVPRFVLRELQAIADSADPLKRIRGRRGLDVLTKLRDVIELNIDERDYDDAGGVDAKLVRLARECGGKLVTNDYNLNRVAVVEGVVVLNVNELAGAVRAVVLPGEELHVAIVRDGKEAHQGVGYLEDGTMIVVENGRRLMGEETDVQVTSVLQTVAGRMIFAKVKRPQGVPSL